MQCADDFILSRVNVFFSRFSDLGLLQKSFDVTETSAKSNYLKTGSIAPQYHASMVSCFFFICCK